MSGRKEAERAAFEQVLYSGTRFLVNTWGLRDAAALDTTDRYLSENCIKERFTEQASDPTYAAFKALHFHVF